MATVLDELSRDLRPPLSTAAAVVEADRCLECGGAYAPAPCVVACPADVDVPRFVAAIAAGDAGLAAAGELAALGHAVTVYDDREEVGGLVRYAIAPYRQTNEPLPAEARLLADLGVEFALGTRVDAARLRTLETEADAVVL